MTKVFISYRREDSAASAGRLFDRLRSRFGADNVFRDIDTIAPGQEFAKVIVETIARCDLLIAVIGREWLTLTDGAGRRRIDAPEDFVRAEIHEALRLHKKIIPVLVDNASIPQAHELPDLIQALAGFHAIEISEVRFDYDTERLIRAANPSQTTSTGWWGWISDEKRQRTLAFIGAGLAAAVVGLWQMYLHFSEKA